MFKHFILSFFIVLLVQHSFSQGTNCSNADPFCTGTTYSFDNNVGNTSQSGPQYGCLSTQPNPAWYYLKIAKAGTIDIFIEQKDLSGNGIDVDFLLWGPYNSVNDGCASGLKSSKHVDCSYLPDPTETANITNAKVGEYYILLLTNYSNKKGKITFSQTGGTGKTDCSVLCDLQISESINKPITCFGGADGEIAITASNGQTPYTYNWSNTATSATISNIAAGNYTVTVTDKAGCTLDKNITIYNPEKVDVNRATGNSTCNGSNDAVVVSWGSGGDGNYSYTWSNGEANNSIFNLTPGTYTVTITDGKGCSETASETLTEPDLLTVQAVANSILCGSSNGNITAVASGGSGTGFVYSTDGVNWSPNGTFSNLPSGSYTILVNDSKNCWGSTEVTINNTSGVSAVVKSQQDVKCHGASTGSFTVEGNGGSGVFNYSIDGGITYLPSGTFNNLTAGYYTVEVLDMDPAGCKVTQAVNLTEPTLINPNITTIAGTCDLPNGSINIVGSNGTPNYTYAIDNATFQVSNNFTGLAKGDYTLTVKDANACTITATTTVGNSGAVTVSVKSQNNILCFGRNEGNILVEGAGTGGYSYSIDGGTLYQPSGLFENLVAGTYTLSVKDKDGCVANTTTSITTPTELKVTAVITNEICGLKNGSITLNANGGTGALQYSLDGAVFQTTPTIGSLSAGIYKPLVKDANGCVVGVIDSIQNTGSVNLSIDSTKSIKCNAGNDGAIYLSANGSIGYLYSIDGINYQAQNNFTALTAGTYTLFVKDAGTCADTTTFVLNEPNPMLVTLTNTTVCANQNVTLTPVISGSACNTYTYNWLPGNQTTKTITVNPLVNTTYTLNVTDCNACSAIAKTVSVNVNPTPVAAGSADKQMGCPELCVNFTDQSTISSGTIQSVLWNFEDLINATSNAKNPTHCYKTTGEYSVKLIAISDRGCSDTITYTNMINVFTKPKANFVYTPENPTISNPQVVFENKSTNANSWIWKFSSGNELTGTSGDKDASYIYPDTGLYIVKLYATSADGCIDSTYQSLYVSPEFSLYIPSAFTPNDDGLNDVFKMQGIYIKNIYMAIFDRWGAKLFDTNDVNVGWNGKASGTDEAIAQGVYVYTVKATDMFGKNYSFSGHVTLLR